MQAIEDHITRRANREDTFDHSDEEHSVLEDDSDNEERDADYMDDDDGSSSLSIPNESIDFDLVYALHSFAATVEGQANVVKGDSLFLMDDSNSYWWLVRVLKTQEVGYIPAENIETPFERLARLNKHRNVDLASATHAELRETRDRLLSSRTGSNQATPSPTPGPRARPRHARGVSFTAALHVHRYPPAVWGDEDDEDEDVEWDDEGYEDEDPDLLEAQEEHERAMQVDAPGPAGPPVAMEPDDGMSWEDGAVEAMQKSQADADAERSRQQQQRILEQQAAQSVQVVQPLRTQSSREQLTVIVQDEAAAVSGSPTKFMDPAAAVETRKISMTPAVARADDQRQQSVQQPQPSPTKNGPMLPSQVLQQQSEERKRTREEIEALEEAARKKANTNKNGGPVSSSATVGSRPASGGKLRKERDSTTDDESPKEKDKKKKGGSVFGGLFGRRKDKDKDKDKGKDKSDAGSSMSDPRESEESGRSAKDTNAALSPSAPEPTSPVTTSARLQQQAALQQQQQSPRQSGQQQQLSTSQGQQQQSPDGIQGNAIQAQISQHASQLRQRDQQQQALYQQYLNRSPSTPPEAQPSYGLQSASVLQGSMSFSSSTSSTSGVTPSTSRPRPGSLVLSPSTMDGQGVGLPDLSVIRVFAGSHLQTEATFKTVLLNASTTASDLVRQAIQRFRLPAGEDENDYYLTIKQVEGSSATLRPHEKPLGVFESLVEAAMELPKVKRSSVGSISSVASNLSMHPAIKKLSMNDFTDDSAVKFYLNRKSDEPEDSVLGEDGEDTLLAESPQKDDIDLPRGSRPQYLTVSPSSANSLSVSSERFSSPSFRFALQLVIYPEDLPDDMVFDPLTEAIVFKDTLRDRSQSSLTSPGLSQTLRRKVFVFPRNVTVAEVIELGLERFGILEGVVDGGDEIEDKLTKRRSSSRVRYWLTVDLGGKERELSPSSKVIDAFPRPPVFRAAERRPTDSKRRSVDSAQILGSLDDVQADDPMFVLRRAVAYRISSSRHRSSAPLDEIALQQLHRSSITSSSIGSDSTAGLAEEQKASQTSKQIIAAQRAATRASQRAILGAQANSVRGLDVILPGNAMIRSSRYDVDDRMRYSYVEPDGGTYDISDIVESEWRGEGSQRQNQSGEDLLHGVLARGKDGLGAKLDRVLSKIKHEKGSGRPPVSQSNSGNTIETLSSMRSTSPSDYDTADGTPDLSSSRTATPTAQTVNGRSASTATSTHRVASSISRLSSYRTASPGSDEQSGARSVTPGASRKAGAVPHERQYSSSAMSDASAYRTANGTPSSPPAAAPSSRLRPRVFFPDDDFGLSQMMAVIEQRATRPKLEDSPVDVVEDMLFGRPLEAATLHPQIRNIYASTFKQLEEMDATLDGLLQQAARKF
ncbi:hypothetical protein B0H21DRAFT_763090 [Amylocystis lapponica]|nr:hypothetical protein B0H21DRAFT_763090 [Amylocystis lapponica]